jgi:hypothetical protein
MPDPNKPNGQARTDADDLRRLEERVRELTEENERLRKERDQLQAECERHRQYAELRRTTDASVYEFTEEDIRTAIPSDQFLPELIRKLQDPDVG